MKKEPSFYMALPVTERDKLREKQKLSTYREYTRNLTGLDINKQMDAESDYLPDFSFRLPMGLIFQDTAAIKPCIWPLGIVIFYIHIQNIPERITT